jgi:PhoH-like ATPase
LKKTFVLDSCVLLLDPSAYLAFQDNRVIVPLAVIEELENFKSRSDLLGKHSRMFSRSLDELSSHASLLEGIQTEAGGIVQVKASSKELIAKLPEELSKDLIDNSILAVAMEVQGVLVTNDFNLKIKSQAVGVAAEPYETDRVHDDDDLYKGATEVLVSGEEMAMLFSGGIESTGQYHENECLMLRCQSNLNQTALAIHKSGQINAIANYDEGVSRIRPQNKEQAFALALLMDPEIPLVTITGKSGCGKTILALAAGLAMVQEQNYQRMLVARPIAPLGGKDLGYLPGSIEEKVSPWMQPVRDNLEVIMSQGKTSRKDSDRNFLKDLEDQRLVQIEPLTYIRGRSIPNQFFLIDEGQNTSKAEIKTILTRAGMGTKIVIVGDIDQVDDVYLDSHSNGLALAIAAFRNSKLGAHITLTKGVRSPLSEAASLLL